jgi:hypothetical protein
MHFAVKFSLSLGSYLTLERFVYLFDQFVPSFEMEMIMILQLLIFRRLLMSLQYSKINLISIMLLKVSFIA